MKAVILAAQEENRCFAGGIDHPKPLVMLGGLSLLERAVRSGARAGVSEFLIVVGARGEPIRRTSEPRLSDLPITWVTADNWPSGSGASILAAAPFLGREHFLVMMADHLILPPTLRHLLEPCLDLSTTLMAIDRKRGPLFDADNTTKVRLAGRRITELGKSLDPYDGVDIGAAVCSPTFLDALRPEAERQGGTCSYFDGMRKLAAAGQLAAYDIGQALWKGVDSPVALKAAETILFDSLRKPTDGFISRHVERYLSRAVTRVLMRTPVTPNAVTLAVIGIGMTAAFLFAQPRPGMTILGALVFWCASFLDGCDGELARLKFRESRLGGWLDLWADNLVHIMVFVGIGIGLWRKSGEAQWILLGIVAALGVVFSVAWVSWAVLRKKRGQGPLFTSVAAGDLASRCSWTARLTRFADALSRRDFIFGTIFLALLGWLPVFLWAAAIGSHIYWIVLVLIAWQHRQASTAEA